MLTVCPLVDTMSQMLMAYLKENQDRLPPNNHRNIRQLGSPVGTASSSNDNVIVNASTATQEEEQVCLVEILFPITLPIPSLPLPRYDRLIVIAPVF